MNPCPRKKCGEYNMLKCACEEGHTGECCFVVDHENDYAHNKPKASQDDAMKKAIQDNLTWASLP